VTDVDEAELGIFQRQISVLTSKPWRWPTHSAQQVPSATGKQLALHHGLGLAFDPV